MSEELELYKQAYERERKARQAAEDVLETRSRELFLKNQELEASLVQLKAQQDALIRSEKLATLGTLVSGVAHEINNPLSFVHSNVDTLGQHSDAIAKLYPLLIESISIDESERPAFAERVFTFLEKEDLEYFTEELDELVADTNDGVQRVKEIVRNLRSFARMDAQARTDADLNEGIRSTLKLINNQISANTRINLSLEEIPPVVCNPGEINQVLLNILVNAAQALEGQREPSLEIASKENQGWVEISIGDNGKGMSKEIQKRIFEPFYTTKDIGKGTGLGLSISYGIVSHHQGELNVESAPNQGTVFTLRLPIHSH
ncbi:MAG: Sporulation kinase E [Marinobacterium sp. xm-d-530]|nr:MAG: Sporulation kinase E [Marinobacterium sp. xm-d-530]